MLRALPLGVLARTNWPSLDAAITETLIALRLVLVNPAPAAADYELAILKRERGQNGDPIGKRRATRQEKAAGPAKVRPGAVWSESKACRVFFETASTHGTRRKATSWKVSVADGGCHAMGPGNRAAVCGIRGAFARTQRQPATALAGSFAAGALC